MFKTSFWDQVLRMCLHALLCIVSSASLVQIGAAKPVCMSRRRSSSDSDSEEDPLLREALRLSRLSWEAEQSSGPAGASSSCPAQPEPEPGLSAEFGGISISDSPGAHVEVYQVVERTPGCCRRRRDTPEPAAAAPESPPARPAPERRQQVPVPEPCKESPAPPPAAERPGPEQPEPKVCEHGRAEPPAEWTRGERFYTVWAAPNSLREIRGVHMGPGSWRGIENNLAGRQYSYHRGHRLRRFPSLDESIIEYYAERLRHGALTQCTLYFWA